MNRIRLPWGAERYKELEELALVLTPLRPTSLLLPEHFATPLQHMRYPVRLDFASDRFRLRSLSLLSQLSEAALQEIDLSDNQLRSITELSRFTALRVLVASRNRLELVQLALPRLTRLDLSGNQLADLPPLHQLPRLQVASAEPAPMPWSCHTDPPPRCRSST